MKPDDFINDKTFNKTINELKNKDMISTNMPLDDYEFSVDEYFLEKLLIVLNDKFPEYQFTVKPWHGGWGIDLVITDIQRQKEYDLLPKTKTYNDLFKELYEKHGIETTLGFHVNGNDKLTEKEYEELLSTYKTLGEQL